MARLQNLDRWVGNRSLRIHNINFAFSLIEFKEIHGQVSMHENVHDILYKARETFGEKRWREWIEKTNDLNAWLFEIEEISDNDPEHGTNHCGLLCRGIHAVVPKPPKAPSFWKRFWNLFS